MNLIKKEKKKKRGFKPIVDLTLNKNMKKKKIGFQANCGFEEKKREKKMRKKKKPN